MSSDMEDLIEQWFEGSLEADQETRLLNWLSEHPSHIQDLVERSVRDQMLREAASGLATENKADRATQYDASMIPSVRKIASWKRASTAVASIAACILVAVIWFGKSNHKSGTTESTVPLAHNSIAFASIVAEQDSDQLNRVGERLTAQTVDIRTGLLRLLFDDGVEVTLQGPARYELVSLGKTRLHSGVLSATVPPGAEGFQVDTPTAEIVDLGTVFGIELTDDGLANVSVFDGEVEVKPIQQRSAALVKQGESVCVSDQSTVEPTDFDLKTYDTLWPVASGIAGSTGAFRFAPPWPRPMGLLQSDTEIFVLPEGYSQSLDKPLKVDIAKPGFYRNANELTERTLAAETRVKSFLLQFRPLDQNDSASETAVRNPNPDNIKRIVGAITFDRPVLGLIVRGEQLRASDGQFSVRGGQVPQRGRALEFGGTPRDDVISLSQDRRTVTLDLAAFGLFSDQVRVIVDHSLER